jgi:uncharacterized membrane protein YfcA
MNDPLASFGLPSEVLVWQALFLGLLSFGVGVVGGLVGLALGTVRLPFLLLLGMPPALAAGTNILVSTLGALTGSYRHLREGRVDFGAVAVQGIPAIIGAFIGGFTAGLVHSGLLIALAGTLVVWQGIELWLRAAKGGPGVATVMARRGPLQASGLSRWSRGQIAAEAVAGFGIGLLGGAVGLVLNTLRLPVLIAVLNLDPRVAAGSNLAIGFLMGSFGWVGHVARGQVDYPVLILMGATAMVGTYFGAHLTAKIKMEALLYLMAAVLTTVGLLLLRDAIARF